ncbi:MAG: DUF58 domain-containing protein [Lachnospiraceae bacterium]|nr:DUF58 domain-containing protein [Lachnospiraceae bacterium]
MHSKSQIRRNRIILAVLWSLSLAGISFYGGPVSYGLFALFTLIPVISVVYLLFVVAFFRIYQEAGSKWLAANHAVPFYFILKNESYFGFAGIRIRFFSSFSTINGLDDGIEYELLPGTGIRKDTELICRYRGEYEVGLKQVEIQDFFRLIQISYRNRETMRVVVRPDLIEPGQLKSVDISNIMTRDSSVNPSQPDVTVREYISGDDVRRMNWKASAVSGRLMVREQTGEEQEDISILLGTERRSGEQTVYLPLENKMLEVVLALAVYFAGKGIRSRTIYLEGEPKDLYVGGLEQFDAYYEAVSAVRYGSGNEESRLMQLMAGDSRLYGSRMVFMVLAEWSTQAMELARILNENNVPVTAYIIGSRPEAPVTAGQGLRVLSISTDTDIREVL